MIGGLIGKETEARALIQDMRDEVRQVREFSSVWPDRPRVYFEEWDAPLIAGIRWVSELIEMAGGTDIFPELRERALAAERVVDPAEVVRRDPQIIVASWCGKKLDPERIRSRPGWDRISAVKEKRIFELDGADILAPGPSLMAGLRQLHEIIQGSIQAR
jgi:iron complex transport system substrate-binding protein